MKGCTYFLSIIPAWDDPRRNGNEPGGHLNSAREKIGFFGSQASPAFLMELVEHIIEVFLIISFNIHY
jgi:hypothetical protein